MGHRYDSSGAWVESGNVPGNPNRSFRMSMLAHGFVDDSQRPEFTLDESDPMSYGVVRWRMTRRRGGGNPLVLGATIAGLFIVFATATVLFA